MGTSFGQQVRKERKKLGLTVERVAKICGTSRSYITLIETGRRLPGKNILPKLATSLHLKTVVVLNWYLEHIGETMRKELKIVR